MAGGWNGIGRNAKRGGQPKNAIFLTADAFGVLAAHIDADARSAVQHFLLGYTAMVAGTERSVTEPVPNFSPCQAAEFAQT